MVSRRIYALALGALTLASCASSSAEEVLPTTAVATTAVATTTSAPATTAATTVVPQDPSTTAVPVPDDSSVPVVDVDRVNLGRSAVELLHGLDACFATPDTCTTESLLVVPGSEAAQGIERTLDTFRTEGWYVVPGGNASYVVLTFDEAAAGAIRSSANEVTIGVCTVDSAVTKAHMGTIAPEDDVVVDDRVLSTWTTSTVQRSGENWLMSSVTVDRTEVGDLCRD